MIADCIRRDIDEGRAAQVQQGLGIREIQAAMQQVLSQTSHSQRGSTRGGGGTPLVQAEGQQRVGGQEKYKPPPPPDDDVMCECGRVNATIYCRELREMKCRRCKYNMERKPSEQHREPRRYANSSRIGGCSKKHS